MKKIKVNRLKNKRKSKRRVFINVFINFFIKYFHYCKYLINILLALLYITLTKFKEKIKNPKVCICAVAKRENLYIKEYVNYYKDLGYSHIFIYDNNDPDDERFEDVIQDEINSNFVTIIDYRGKKRIQCEAYIDCYEKYNKDYDWLSFFDIDEFLEIKPHAKTIQQFLTNKRYANCDTIKINFLFYSDNELLYYENKPLQERFTTPLYKHGNNAFIKSTVRGGLKVNYWSQQCYVHTSAMKCNTCNSLGRKIAHNSLTNSPPSFEYARLRHFYTKSTEEYLIKSSRGSAGADVRWDNGRKKFKYNLYFVYNKRTKEKEDLLKKLFNMTL